MSTRTRPSWRHRLFPAAGWTAAPVGRSGSFVIRALVVSLAAVAATAWAAAISFSGDAGSRSNRLPEDPRGFAGRPLVSGGTHTASDGANVHPLTDAPDWTAESDQAGALMGYSVSTAGDVNGDGFSDVIVGAWTYDGGQTNEGRAFVFHGSGGGLGLTPAWTAESKQAGAFFGYSVATAGDVNGDGFDDVIVGAFRYDGGQTDEGRVFVFHGSADGLSSTPSWTAESDQANAEFGSRVASAGDTNGDGFDDVIVGAPFFDSDLSNEGRAFVYLGSETGLSATPAWSAEGNQTGVQFGAAVATAGDVNADGFSDVVVGAWVYTNAQAQEGRAFVFHGSSDGLNVAPDWSAEGDQANAFFGTSVAGAGDVDGDGYGDVIVGAPGYDNGQSGEGRIHVYRGGSNGLEATAAWVREPHIAEAAFGQSVATAGDINGDGFADVIIGAPNLSSGQAAEGRASVFRGGPLGLEPNPSWSEESDQASANFGSSVATAGDVDGDGFSDALIGAPGFDGGQSDEGSAFAYNGTGDGLQSFPSEIEGNQPNSDFGWSVASAGDVNGDGYSDVIVGAPQYGDGEAGGMAYVFLGSAIGIGALPDWSVEGDQAQAGFGASVAGVGDVNGDGYSDVIIGAPGFDGVHEDEGRAFVYHGSAVGLTGSPAWIGQGDEAGLLFGSSVATAGDVNGDGFSDAIIGATGALAQAPLGRAIVFHGSASGLESTPAWTALSDQAESNFGCSVATAGDIDGDGFSDILVGADHYDSAFPDQGRVFLYEGSPNGLGPLPPWTTDGGQVDAQLGSSVATAGDVNGDGFSDVIAGARSYEGEAFVYHGSVSGLGAVDWSATGGQPGCEFGASVATAGDVDGDGFSDVVVGAPRFEVFTSDAGQAFLFRGSASGLATLAETVVGASELNASMGFSVSTAGDLDADGFSDVVVGGPGFRSGGGVTWSLANENGGLPRNPQQRRVEEATPIALLGASDSPSQFRVTAMGRSAGGRGRVRLELEVKPLGVPFDGSGLQIGDMFDTGGPSPEIGSAVPLGELVTGLSAKTLYHWRLRIASRSPFFPRSPWVGPAGNAPTEADLRTASLLVDVAVGATASGGVTLDPVWPNPLRSRAEMALTLPATVHVRLSAYDVSGRQVAVLVDGVLPPGRHRIDWLGRDDSGSPLPGGVYFLRLETAVGTALQKVVIAR